MGTQNIDQEANDFDGGFDEKDGKDGKSIEQEGRRSHDSGDGPEQAGDEIDRGQEEQQGQEEQVEPKPEETVDWKAKAEETEKRAKDNQAAFTKSQQELAETRKKLEETEGKLKPAGAQEPEEFQYPDEVAQFFNDFPEAKAAVGIEAERIAAKKIKELFGDIDAGKLKTVQDTTFALQWENTVTRGYYDEQGNYVPGVQDYYEITAQSNKPYWDWYASKGYAGCDPVTAIARLKEWKTLKEVERVASEAGKGDQAAKDRAKQIERAASGSLPSSQRRVSGEPSKKDENDFDGGFDD
jgi:hypothetical protein